MEKTYEITGMKCDGCVKKVTESFSGVAGVTKVGVSLANANAVVAGDFDEQSLKAALKGTHYSIKL
ncbi:heavy metal-associated domain-containing protein [Lactobacillus sp. UCMA15818]|uniref:heavy-metal-associated domain-containing protein n=1 Tax=Lactobacillaceae TaxID=33958 RepID=UPI0025B160E1|nr:heavy metal-associated domain-containing protein [Lactobacillus sp. UCMA15818]MDN2453517.1 heavy-metal-associated domain-containing protein [Lactobacillus sp. UCMA15818]